MSHCSFDLHFSNRGIEHLFMCILTICMFSLEKRLFRFSDCVLVGIFFFFCYWVIWAVCKFWRLIPCQSSHMLIFFPVLWIIFCVFFFFLWFPLMERSFQSLCELKLSKLIAKTGEESKWKKNQHFYKLMERSRSSTT